MKITISTWDDYKPITYCIQVTWRLWGTPTPPFLRRWGGNGADNGATIRVRSLPFLVNVLGWMVPWPFVKSEALNKTCTGLTYSPPLAERYKVIIYPLFCILPSELFVITTLLCCADRCLWYRSTHFSCAMCISAQPSHRPTRQFSACGQNAMKLSFGLVHN